MSAVATVSCIDLGPFECMQDDQCRIGGVAGICATGYCALPDDSCASGFSFHERAPADLAGRCVDPPSATTTTGDVSTSTSSSSGSNGTTGSASADSAPLTGGQSTGVLCGDRPCACAVEIAAGEEHTCAVREDGSVVCWGRNDQGELGIGFAGEPEPWPQVVALPSGVTASGLAMGNHVTCVTGSDGALYCWGRNPHGEVLPVGMPEPQPQPVEIDFVPAGGAYGSSPRHSCVAAADGATLSCFGENLRGQLGDVGPEPGPYSVMDPGGLLPPIDQVAAGRQHTCARSGPLVSCWGADDGGALGDGLPVQDTSVPGAVLLADDAVHLTSGRAHACAAIGDGRRVQCWGDNAAGQLATGAAGMPAEAPVDAIEMFDAPIDRFVSRLDSTCVMTTSGALRCWGANAEDKYGTGNAFEPSPVEVSILGEIAEPPIAVALGEWHMCLVTEGAHVYCWGADDVEQLGPFDPMPGERAVELDLRCPEA